MNEQQQSVLEVLVAFAVIIKSVYHITGAPIKDGHEEKNSSRVAEPHSVRRKLAAHLARSVFHAQLMENLSCDVSAWRSKVSSKLKDDGGVGSLCCGGCSSAGGTFVRLSHRGFDVQLENAAPLFMPAV